MQKHHARKFSKKANQSKLIRNSIAVIALVEAITLPFIGFSIVNFFIILTLVLLFIWAMTLLVPHPAKGKYNKREKAMQSYNGSHSPEIFEPRPSRKNSSHKLVKLEKKNFNWSIKDIERNFTETEVIANQTQEVKEPPKEELIKRYNPYRSPFEPIYPPRKQEEEKEAELSNSLPPERDLSIENTINSVESDVEAGITISEIIGESDAAEDPLSIIQDELHHGTIDQYNSEFSIEDDVEKLVTAATEVCFDEHAEAVIDDLPNEAVVGRSKDKVVSLEDRKILQLVIKQKNEEKQQEKPASSECKEDDYKEEKEYILPSVNLLKLQKKMEDEEIFDSETEYTANKLIETLASFGVGAKVLDVSKGPSVTRYELQPNAGVKVSKIVGLSDDIALNLAATGVRIEAPIPGKAAVGIEVPNKEVTSVLLRDVIESQEFQNHPSKLAFAVGKDVAGRTVVGDISKMPHMLIAGATGSGKSVCINTLIASILYKASPSEVKLLMVDPKVVELGIYNGIPHLLIPVVTDPKKAAGALNWAVIEMTTRYKLFAENNVRDLKGYNNLIEERGGEALPQIVIIIDELADLMMVAPNDVEDCICRLAQMARAAGMHLVIATQRPSVDVITGVIKANIPSRISFAVSSQIDSRTILDMAGAEKLLGRGDMLYNPIGEPKPIRVQGGFISDKEVESIVADIKSSFQAEYDQDILDKINSQSEPQQQPDSNDDDELLPQAIEMVIEYGQASASLIQRKFKVGYSRAARILDQMEAWGVVSPADGSKPRQILLTMQEWDELNS